MTEKETTSGGALWRKRAVATASIAAVACAGSVALASSASAAPTAPKLTVTAPAKLANNGTSSGLFTIRVDNSASGNTAIPPATTPNLTTAHLVINVTLPTGLACSALTFTPNSVSNEPPAAVSPDLTAVATTTPGQCSFQTTDPFTQPADSNYLYGYNFSVNATAGATGSTGTITSNVALTETINGTTTVTSTSNSATTTLGAPAAPTLVAPTTPATIYQGYSFKVVTDSGTPSTLPTPAANNAGGAGYRVFQAPTTKTGTTYGTGSFVPLSSVPDTTAYGTSAGDPGFHLVDSSGGGCFYFDTVTGSITNGDGNCDAPNTTTDSAPAFSYTIIANNGVGGAAQTAPGDPTGGTTAPPTPNTAVNDVATAPFTLPVLFSDVALSSFFATQIYGLSDIGGIKGFADGTYRPAQKVTRQELVNILVNYDPASAIPSITGNGECTTFEPSAFSDVPNSSIFCEAIKYLSQVNVIRGSGGKFRPTAVVNRQEFSGILYRFYTLETTGNVLNGDAPFTPPSAFSDVSASNVFAGDIQFAVKKGFIKGYTDGKFHPGASTTRDTTAALIYRTGVSI